MLKELFPRAHARYAALPVLGPHLDSFAAWLHEEGYPQLPIRLRVRAAKDLDLRLRRRGVRKLESLTREALLHFAPRDSQEDVYRAALVRSLEKYLAAQGRLSPSKPTPVESLVASYREYLERVRGLAAWTVWHHGQCARMFLRFLGFDRQPSALHALEVRKLEAFVRRRSEQVGRGSLQHEVAHLRSFLRFLASRGEVAPGLDRGIDTPRLYRRARPPRALSWETVQALLDAIDRSTPMGRRDFAMLMLVATYGLRACEVVALRLDDVKWRAGVVRVRRPKLRAALDLPLTDEVGAALVDYIRHGRPDLPVREVFLRARAPAGTLRPTALSESFQAWVRRSGLSISYQGPHCLRHSLAVHLLRQGTPLKAIGDLLGHRSAESTCVYLSLHLEDLREVPLDLPDAAGETVR